ncbi:MAG TPA: hypothetical protein VJ810_38730 [Blastocatellia bacterium]|nr:hypothetical protein [Blastocatellia bacterium]
MIFTVDERLTGRPPIPNDEIAAFAAENTDIMFAVANVDPTRGQEAEDRHPRRSATVDSERKCVAAFRRNVIIANDGHQNHTGFIT